ncbi:ABC transporter substrate-binding protein [Shewanella seohaensis]|uniref:ABC transporter substrate-binding protein n=1 Tax=Shewanella seohaensis TaxID=755175 RepID=UPI0035B815D0
MSDIKVATKNPRQKIKINISKSLLLLCTSLCLSVFVHSARAAEPIVVLTTFSEEPMGALFEEFKQLNPDISIQVVYRRTGPALKWVQQSSINPVDMIISSSPTFFHDLDNEGLIVTPLEQYEMPAWLTVHDLTKSNKTIALGYSGITIMYNQRYLEKNNLPIPHTWKDLAAAQFSGHIMMSTPNNSGTTHMMVEGVLQQKGWQQGWALLREVGGNLASVSARSFGVSESISRGLVGAGVVIDSYAIDAKNKFTFTDFNYLPNTVILPTYISVTPRGRNKANVTKLIQYFLSNNGQTLISSSAIAKHSLTDASLAQSSHPVINEDLLFNRATIINALFDQVITYQLPKLQLAWKLIHQAEAKNNISPDEQNIIKQARQLASTVPINEAESLQLQHQFIRQANEYKHATEIEQIMYQWRKESESQLDQAISLMNSLASQKR